MVLPSRVNVPETPDRQSSSGAFYEVNKGHILNHFAGIATSDVSGPSNKDKYVNAVGNGGSSSVQLHTRRAGFMNGNYGGRLEDALEERNLSYDNNNDHELAISDLKSEAHSIGATVVKPNYSMEQSDNNNDDAQKPFREEMLEQWRRKKESNGAAQKEQMTKESAAVPIYANNLRGLGTGHPKNSNHLHRPHSFSGSTLGPEDSNNQADGTSTTNFSPPRHHSVSSIITNSATYSQNNSPEIDPINTWKSDEASEGARRLMHSSSFNASLMGDSNSNSSGSIWDFIGRDVQEEEQALHSRSDKERAFLYKKRYSDLYNYTVDLAKQMVRIKQSRADKINELKVLKSKVQTQNRIIETMSENTFINEPGDYKQEKKLQALCREVGTLVHQLSERDSYIRSLLYERDESSRVTHDLRRSREACESRSCDSQNTNNARPQDVTDNEMLYDGKVAHLQQQLDLVTREKKDALRQVSALMVRNAELQQQVNASEAQLATLSMGLHHHEEQMEALHIQWTQEKKDLTAKDSEEVSRLTAVCERLRLENETLKSSLARSSENEQKYLAMLETQQRATDESQAFIDQLQSKSREMQSKMDELAEKEQQIRNLEYNLSSTVHVLEETQWKVQDLEEQLVQKERDIQIVEESFLAEINQLKSRIFQAEIIRRSLHNKVMELKGNIRVFCRVRPVLRHEAALTGNEEIFAFPDYTGMRRQIELHASPKSHVSYGQNGSKDQVKKYPFEFDLVFNGGCSQEEVFLEVSALIQSALDGYNVCIFAYGQTGSGKTYTMQGREEANGGNQTMELTPHTGIVGRAISHIFSTVADLRSSGWDFSVSLELIEIYNDTLRDLLAPAGSIDKVDLRLDSDGKPMVMNSFVHTVENEAHAMRLLQGAMSKRATKATNMNDRSSRSHCVLTFRVNGVNSLTGDTRVGVINLVDLAGSERLSKSGSGNDKELMKEALAINKSLSSLGNVICALAKKSAHVPFRDSKLTHFLSPSLGGDSKTLMICNLSPLGQHREETLNSLRFAKTVNSCEIAYPSISSRSS